MKKVLMIAVALLVAVAFVTPVIAQDKAPAAAGPTPTPKGPSPSPKSVPSSAISPADSPAPQAGPGGAPKVGETYGKKTTKYAGQVTKVDGAMVTVKGKKDEKTFDVSKAKFVGYKGAAEIKDGDKVSLRYSKDGDKLAAESLAKAGAKEKPGKGAISTADSPAPGTGPGGAPKVGEPLPKK